MTDEEELKDQLAKAQARIAELEAELDECRDELADLEWSVNVPCD